MGVRLAIVEEGGRVQGHLIPPAEALVGRRAELEALEAWWSGEEAGVALVGPPGSGKTRLALGFAEVRALRWRSLRVWSVDLQHAARRVEVVDAVMDALGLSGAAHQDVEERAGQVSRWLEANVPALVVLDNLEQLEEEALEAVQGWIASSGEVRWVVTTQRRSGLEVPRVEVGALGGEDAVELLRAAGRRAAPAARWERGELEALARSLDGHALALSLAGARLALVTPQELVRRVEHILDVLDRPAQGAGLRAGLRAAWHLLAPEEQAALEACAVFRGAFSLEAAEAVLGAGALEALHRLHEASLVEIVRQGEVSTFRLLASVRAFAASGAGGEARAAAQRRYILYFGELARELARRVERTTGCEPLDALAGMREHLMGVTEEAERLGEAGDDAVRDAAADAALGLELVERFLGAASGVGRALEIAARLVGGRVGDARRVRVHVAQWHLYRARGQRSERVEALEGALTAVEGCADPCAVALAWRCEAIERWGRRQMDAAHLALERALEAAQRAPDEAALGQVLIVQAWLALESGSTEEVIRRAEHAMVLLDAAEAEYAYVTEAGNLSLFLMNLGMIEASRARAMEGLVRCRRKRFRTLEAQFVRTLAATGLLLDAPDTDRLLEEASALSLEQSPGAQADLCIFQAWRARFTGRDQGEALERMRAAVVLRRKLAIPRMLSFALQDLAVLALDCGEVGLAGEALREGLALAQVGILPAQEALWVGLQGILAAHRGEAAEAERLIGRQRELQVAIQHPRFRFGVELDAATVACLLGRGEAASVEETLVGALRPEPPLWGLPGEPQPRWRLSRGMRASVRRLLAAAPVGVRERAWAAALDPAARSVVAVSADAWRLPGGEWVRLEGNPTLARVFNALVEARLGGDAGAVGVEALVSAGWPDEQILPDAAANRLHQAIARLRRQGLRGVLESCEGGYRVPREVAVLGCPAP